MIASEHMNKNLNLKTSTSAVVFQNSSGTTCSFYEDLTLLNMPTTIFFFTQCK
jgi:hypothetical protein